MVEIDRMLCREKFCTSKHGSRALAQTHYHCRLSIVLLNICPICMSQEGCSIAKIDRVKPGLHG